MRSSRFVIFRAVLVLVLVVVGLFVGVPRVAAGIILVTSRSALGATDSVDWGSLHLPTLTPIPNPFIISSGGGVNVTVSEQQPGVFIASFQGNPSGGDFAPGDALLYTGNQFGSRGGPITLDFGAHLVSGGGTQIEPNASGSFTATIEAFDSQGHSLGNFTETGIFNGNGDNSAIFIGVLDSSREIAKISVDVTTPTPFSASGHDFLINRFDFVTPQVSAVPAPSGLTLASLGVVGLLGCRCWRRCRPALA